eukprot:CAMPEP_0175162240 /NCGR_PEP_ID=MMETSP0087-20121206/25048_1 /TAXON_ID=136419 /ORGANISM="Unknown Unknown, Strain D1" /LENGTH=328 /DNA_ID=CAMNT_0016450739 /DNA_START=120 /DNA_END=1104 /DNA_ORIENTATION=+
MESYAGEVCRAKADPKCDMSETCDGSSPKCPKDIFQPNGLSCTDLYEDDGTCWNGICSNVMASCQSISKTNSYGGMCIKANKDDDEAARSKAGGCMPFTCYSSKDEAHMCKYDFAKTTYRYVGYKRGFPCGSVDASTKMVDKVCSGGIRNDGVGSECVALMPWTSLTKSCVTTPPTVGHPGSQTATMSFSSAGKMWIRVADLRNRSVSATTRRPVHGERTMLRVDYSKRHREPCLSASHPRIDQKVKEQCYGLTTPNDITRLALHKEACEIFCQPEQCAVPGIDSPTPPTNARGDTPTPASDSKESSRARQARMPMGVSMLLLLAPAW